ncbi:filamentous hemagglutinin N-terminal domain-containing protein [Helicobacter pullorum]|uniref:filamentous hemagglutinin N-terminal domain-containing protein n=1 Tax=Helicobacter pullorum TaxID=35818 RepID=UPI000816AA36|nr:filamentous hemagglutinin N-terminal domain-containing protein [Helicobacter pullorum]OCR13571.1 hypothetical protein BA915_08570 [Helicobacter pullorum]
MSQSLAAADIANNALPSGGKFTHGSGSITTTSGKVMNITGNNTNHIIAWGGGFNIGKDAEVNFNTSHGRQASFLNLDYTNKSSQILGNLNGNGNNIYLVNPSGVLIGQNANINANKFVASNIIDDTTLNSFKNKVNDTNAITTFSPVFKPNKGNIVNLGTIKANNGITLIGDTIDIRGGKIENTKGGTNKDNSIYFVGENIYIDADAVNLSSNNIYATAFKEGYIQKQMRNFQKDRFTFGNFNQLITNESYAYNDNGNINDKSGQNNFKKVITLGNGNADEALSEWYWFANGWNNNNGDTRSVDEFRLVENIDFSKQLNGQDRYIIDFSKNENDIDRKFTYSGNYADPNGKKEKIRIRYGTISEIVDTFYGDSMIVGSGGFDGFSNPFVANFNGNGHTLSNIDIDMDEQYVPSHMLGVFGVIGEIIGDYNRSVTIQNLIVDTININSNNRYMGNKSGSGIDGGTYAGGLVGYVGDIVANYPNLGLINFENIVVSNVEIVSKNEYGSVYLGGFAGSISAGSVSNIFVNNVKGIKAFTNSTFGNGSSFSVNLGGFAGHLYVVKGAKNIVLNGMGNIINEHDPWNTTNSIGGFVGLSRGNLSNIYVYFKPNSVLKSAFVIYDIVSIFGKFDNSWTLDNVNLYYNFDTTSSNSIANLPHYEDYYNQTLNPSIPAQDKINLYTYTNSTNKRDEFNTKIKQTFGDNIVILGNDIEGWNYHFNPRLNNPALPTLDMDNLFNKGGYFDSSSWLTKDDFNQSILDSILGKDNQGNSNLIFDLLTQDLESIRQSLDFLVSFLDGENDIKELFGDYYKVNDNIYGALNQDLTINLKFSNFIEALKQNKNINLAFLKDYRDKLNTYNQNKKLYQSGGLPPLEQESLKKLLEEQYNELLNLEQTAKINLESLQGLIKDSFKTDTNYTIFAKESLSPLNFTINIGSLDNFEDTQGNGDNNNRFTPPSEVQKIADLASKEAILILPAQEKQEAIVEDGKERGRLCIVSDNAKTNNPCMAITY